MFERITVFARRAVHCNRMRIRSIRQLNYRNLSFSEMEFPAGIIAITGENAAGKSNVLEALYLAATGELPSGQLAHTVRTGETEGFVGIVIETARGIREITVGFAPGRRQLRLDNQLTTSAELAKHFTAVLMNPEDNDLIHGPPAGRRRYIDSLLSRISLRYALMMREYLRVVEQRNAILKGGGINDPTFELWTDQFIQLGTEIDNVRSRLISRLTPLVTEVYTSVSNKPDVVHTELLLKREVPDLAEAVRAHRAEEIARRVTVVGPHRDDVLFTINDYPVATHGSRGEGRSVALALKIAELRLLTEKHGEAPVLLMDDFTAELDANRQRAVLQVANEATQSFITGTTKASGATVQLTITEGALTADG